MTKKDILRIPTGFKKKLNWSSRAKSLLQQMPNTAMITTIICLSCPLFSTTAADRMLNVNASFPTKDKTQDLWEVTLCNLVDIYQYQLHGTSCSFQTLTSIYKTIWCHTSEDWLLWKPRVSTQAKSNWIAISCIFCSLWRLLLKGLVKTHQKNRYKHANHKSSGMKKSMGAIMTKMRQDCLNIPHSGSVDLPDHIQVGQTWLSAFSPVV